MRDEQTIKKDVLSGFLGIAVLPVCRLPAGERPWCEFREDAGRGVPGRSSGMAQ